MLCMPALIYFIFAICHVVIDMYRGSYNLAIMEAIIGGLITFLLNTLCTNDMSVVSWIVVSIPFIWMTVIAIILLTVFKLNPFGKPVVSAPPISTEMPFHGVNGKSTRPMSSN